MKLFMTISYHFLIYLFSAPYYSRHLLAELKNIGSLQPRLEIVFV